MPKAYSEAVSEARHHARSASPTSRSPTWTTARRCRSRPRSTSAPSSPCPTTATWPSRSTTSSLTTSSVTQQLDALRERFGTLTGVDRPVQTGDYVALDLSAELDGEEIEGGSASGRVLRGRQWRPDRRPGRGTGRRRRRRRRRPSRPPCRTATTPARTPRSPSRSSRSRRRNCRRRTTSSPSWPANSTPSTSCETTCAPGWPRQRPDPGCAGPRPAARAAARRGRLPAARVRGQGRDRVARARRRPLSSTTTTSASTEFLEQEGKTREEFDAELREIAERSVKSQFLLDAVADAEGVSRWARPS